MGTTTKPTMWLKVEGLPNKTAMFHPKRKKTSLAIIKVSTNETTTLNPFLPLNHSQNLSNRQIVAKKMTTVAFEPKSFDEFGLAHFLGCPSPNRPWFGDEGVVQRQQECFSVVESSRTDCDYKYCHDAPLVWFVCSFAVALCECVTQKQQQQHQHDGYSLLGRHLFLSTFDGVHRSLS